MVKPVRMQIWQLRDAYFYWWFLADEDNIAGRLWDFYQLCVGLRARRAIMKGGR